MTRPDGRGGIGPKRCPECGVELKAGLKYCDFCGRKVATDNVSLPGHRLARGRAGGVLKGIVVIGLAIGILVYVGNRRRGQETAPAAPPSVLDGKHQASAACEASIRQQVRGPFRVIAFRSALVAEEGGGYTVAGTVELQSAAGDLQRKRYFCRAHPDPLSVMVLVESKLD